MLDSDSIVHAADVSTLRQDQVIEYSSSKSASAESVQFRFRITGYRARAEHERGSRNSYRTGALLSRVCNGSFDSAFSRTRCRLISAFLYS